MRFFPRARALIAVLAGVVTAALLFAAGPAAAAPAAVTSSLSEAALAGMADCPSSWVCIWADTNFGGTPGKWQDNEDNYGDWAHSTCSRSNGRWSNCASSVYNHGEHCNVAFYDAPGYGGANLPLRKGSYLAYLTDNRMSDGTVANDRFESHRWFQCT
jgi:peptidase inhibitor family I36